MEIIQVLPLFSFLLFCSYILFSFLRLKRKGVLLCCKNTKFKTTFSAAFLIVFFVLFLSELVFHAFQYSLSFVPKFLRFQIHPSSILSLFGVALMNLSLFLLHLTLKAFKNSLRFGLDSKNLGKLVKSGIFAYSRNPFFIAIFLQFLGISLVLPTVFFVSISALSGISIHLFILKEEKFMRRNYGEEYVGYCKKVRRYF